jgi:hypothetical protein
MNKKKKKKKKKKKSSLAPPLYSLYFACIMAVRLQQLAANNFLCIDI